MKEEFSVASGTRVFLVGKTMDLVRLFGIDAHVSNYDRHLSFSVWQQFVLSAFSTHVYVALGSLFP